VVFAIGVVVAMHVARMDTTATLSNVVAL